MSRKRLEKLFEYESKQGAAIWAEDLMLLDAYDLNHDAGTCMSLRPSDDSHRNTMGSERHNDVGLHDFASDEKKRKTGDEARGIPNTARDPVSFRASDELPSCFVQRLFRSEIRASKIGERREDGKLFFHLGLAYM